MDENEAYRKSSFALSGRLPTAPNIARVLAEMGNVSNTSHQHFESSPVRCVKIAVLPFHLLVRFEYSEHLLPLISESGLSSRAEIQILFLVEHAFV